MQKKVNFFRKRCVHSRGFTLIEIMVVLAIMGIMLGLGMFAFGDGGLSEKLEQESNRLYGLIKLAQEEAILNTSELALELEDDGYVFKRSELNEKTNKEEWNLIAGDKIFRKRSLTAGIELELNIENEIFKLNDKNQDDDEPLRIYILSSGELSAFVLSLKIGELEQYFEITGIATGKLSIERKQDS